MFGRKKKGPPDTPFDHEPDCKIKRADPTAAPVWNEVRTGAWERRCACRVDYHYAPVVDDRLRNDPLDPKTSRHAGECEYRDETDPAQLKLLLDVKDGTGGPYWWVTCHHCRASWQVLHFALESVG